MWAVLAVLAIMLPGVAQAHTVDICWRAEADGSITFFAGTYHPGTDVRGSLIVDGTQYRFTSTQATLPSDITECQPVDCTNNPPPVRWQVVNASDIDRALHTFTTTCTGHVECPATACYPQSAVFGTCPDGDGDGRCDDEDNCPSVSNPDQSDADGDGEGDACDACPLSSTGDTDGDGTCDDADNCPRVSNPDQDDADGDGLGDVCDDCPVGSNADSDGDGVCDGIDNCPSAHNPDQSDIDGDGLGDACDDCSLGDEDGDGLCGGQDACPGTVTPESVPTVELLVNHFADIDGDGVFETTEPNGVGPQRYYTLESTRGCTCEQIIDTLGLGDGHRKHGCSVGVMDEWSGWLRSNGYIEGAGCSVQGPRGPAPWAIAVAAGFGLLLLRRRKARRASRT